MRSLFVVTLSFLLLCACGSTPVATKSQTKESAVAAPDFRTASIANKLPHATDSYTQGLLIDGGKMYESVGQYGSSALRVVNIASGRIEREVKLADQYFAEGLAIHNGKLYQLTWMENTCLVYDAHTLRQLSTFRYSGEGWGLVAHNDSLLMSDGSSTIRVVDPTTFRTTRTFTVRDNRGEVALLNELEMINGKLYANIYLSPVVAVIDPATGIVESYIDCSTLTKQISNASEADVLNGIAYDQATGKLYLTGKLWDTMFEIKNSQN